jgi:hypothetical protein
VANKDFFSCVNIKAGVTAIGNTMADVFYQYEFESVQGGKSNFLLPIQRDSMEWTFPGI